MFNFMLKLPSFSGVAAGASPSVQLERGRNIYRTIVLNYAESGTPANEATMKASIKRVQMKINGITRFSVSGKYIIDILNKYYGISFTAGQLIIPLARPWLKTMAAEENVGWGMRNVSTFEIQVELDAGATNPTLSGDAFVTVDANGRDLGSIIEVHEVNFASATSGKFEIPSLPKGNGDLVALHMDNANITHVEAIIDRVPFIEGDLGNLQKLYEWTAERTKQAGYVHIDALVLNRLGDIWPISKANSFNVNPTLSAAGSVPIIMETLNTPLA